MRRLASQKAVGDYGEDAALRALQKKGYRLLTRNYHVRGGEIDLIMEKDRRLVFVEVKTRRNDHFGGPFEALTAGKRQRLQRAAQVYLMQNARQDCEISFCVAGVFLNNDEVTKIEILDPAF